MPDDLDLSRVIGARTRSAPVDHVGRFRLELPTGRWAWTVEPSGPARDLSPDALLRLSGTDLDGADLPGADLPGPDLGASDIGGPSTTDLVAAGSTVAATVRLGPGATSSTVLLLAEPERDAGGTVVAVVGHLVDLGADRDHGELLERVRQLESALRTRPVIEQAKGVLMVLHRCPEDVAFRLLISASQAMNRKLRDIAAEVVDAVAADQPLPEPTRRVLSWELAQLRRRDAAAGPPRR